MIFRVCRSCLSIVRLRLSFADWIGVQEFHDVYFMFEFHLKLCLSLMFQVMMFQDMVFQDKFDGPDKGQTLVCA